MSGRWIIWWMMGVSLIFSLRASAGRTACDTLPKVIVVATPDKGSEQSVLQLQSLSGKIVDMVSAERVQQSSDLSVADITRRVNGLSVTIDHSGQSDLTIIRGIDPKYNYTSVDGIKVPSPGDRSRYVPLSIFPAELIERVEVYKSLTPEMEGDAIGGVVNLVLKDAPSQPMFNLRLATGYSQAFVGESYLSFDRQVVDKRSPYELHGPRYSATGSDFTRPNLSFTDRRPAPDLVGSCVWGRRFDGQQWGVLVAGDYQSIKSGVSSRFIPPNNEPQFNNSPGLTDFYVDRYSATIIRKGLHARVDFTPNGKNSISLYQLYSGQEDVESRHRIDTSLTQGRSEPGTGRITISDRSRLHFQNLYSASLRGAHQPAPGWGIEWTLAYALATGLYPDWAELSAGTARIEQPNGSIVQDTLLLDPLTRIWLRNREQDLSGYLHAGYQWKMGGRKLAVSAGGLYRAKDRNNFYNSYTFQPAITGSYGQPFVDIYHAVWTNDDGPQNPLGAVANPNTYTAHEYIGAGYAMLTVGGKRTEWSGGLRYEHTRQQFVSSVDPTVSYGKQGTISYADWLPSLQVRYRLGEKQQLRAAWYESISRPALYDVTFYNVTYEDYIEAGNPFLRRAGADNVDLRYEWYPGELDNLLAGIFYKHISDPYEKTLLNAGDELYPLPSQGLSYTPAQVLTGQMRNGPAATDYGFEFAAVRYFGRLGVQAGYTYTNSRITLSAKFKTRQDPADPSSNLVTVTRMETRPLQGQSPHLANFGLIFRDDHRGWVARVTAIYTGQRIYSASGWYGLDYWQRGYMLVDAGIEKKFGRHFRAFVKAANLFNTITTVDLRMPNPEFASAFIPGQQRADRITVMRQVEKTAWYAGIRWAM
ncbi:MAG TPA: TonB-dependent receptor [Puia sp.]|nr:TonB-dependent receptor [Puia sp.]